MKNKYGYELFYSSGGHGGPYRNLKEARKWAKLLLKGGSDRSIEIRLSDFKTVREVITRKRVYYA